MNYDKRISWLADNLEHPRFKAKIKETAEKFQSSEKDVRKAIYAKSPVSAHAAGLSGAGVDGLPQCVFDMINKFEVTDEEVADIEDPYFMYLDVISEGKLIAIVGLPSAGKTTIMEFICSKIDKTILYINADISKADIKEARRKAKAGDYRLLCPDVKTGLSMDDVTVDLNHMAHSGSDLSPLVIVIDTLKKLTEVINKKASANIYKLLRSLTGKGASVICLGHCNKYPDQEGWPIYEGTSDLRSDFDELGLMHSMKGDYGMVTVSLYWEDEGWPYAKVRSLAKGKTWTIDKEDNRKVNESDRWVDTVALSKDSREAKRSADLIRDIHNLLKKRGGMLQGAIVKAMEGSHPQKATIAVLKRYVGVMWTVSTKGNTGQMHEAIEDADLPEPKAQIWGM